jgi:hypothetical protein
LPDVLTGVYLTALFTSTVRSRRHAGPTETNSSLPDRRRRGQDHEMKTTLRSLQKAPAPATGGTVSGTSSA